MPVSKGKEDEAHPKEQFKRRLAGWEALWSWVNISISPLSLCLVAVVGISVWLHSP